MASGNIITRNFTEKEKDGIHAAARKNRESMQVLTKRAILKEAGLPAEKKARRKPEK